jgi:hypothetical protein
LPEVASVSAAGEPSPPVVAGWVGRPSTSDIFRAQATPALSFDIVFDPVAVQGAERDRICPRSLTSTAPKAIFNHERLELIEQARESLAIVGGATNPLALQPQA